jgi:hypothetical protein
MLAVWLLALACDTDDVPGGTVAYTETRDACADATATRQVLWGDFHAHGAFSFDARNYQTPVTPDQALAFAAGESVLIAPMDDAGGGTRQVQLDRPLDFVSITEHGEFLGEVAHCTTPGSPGYDDAVCAAYQGEADNNAFDFGVMLADPAPARDTTLCGDDGTGCEAAATERWQAMQAATEAAYDRGDTCAFAPFHGYEYTNTYGVSNLHRNVIFRNDQVPALPITTFEAPTPLALWRALDAECSPDGLACDALVLPHNSNLSNGQLFHREGYGAQDSEDQTPEARAETWALRARMEPVAEIFQHKGDSECRNGFGEDDDPACDFEKLRDTSTDLCSEDELGAGGMRLWGCLHELDFLRAVLKEGLSIQQDEGINPYRLGVIGSTDTHNGTPGLVRPVDYPGHVGIVDDTPDERLGEGNITHDTLINSTGGLAAVWAVENSRDAIWEAFQRRETYASSGPRIELRFFGGWGLDDDTCESEDRLANGYTDGVPMGGVLAAPGLFDDAPRFHLEAWADAGTELEPGTGLASLQIIKGWITAAGVVKEQVYTVAEGTSGSIDTDTCESTGGSDHLCTVWEDPDFDPDRAAFYYARVLQVQTCRWSQRECNGYTTDDRPATCDDGTVPTTVQDRAWSSSIWTATD